MLLPVTQNDDEAFSDVISDEALRIFETVVNGGILPVLVLCGVIGNVINMAVFPRALRLTGVYLGFLLTSNTITLVIALQRSIVVISPLSAKKLLTSSANK
nr:hypothetical protein BaRGS_009208 [Batillaria attramentaria]